MEAPTSAHSEPERQLIAFSLHGEHYGLPIASVREIIRYTPPRVTATARGLIQGMINLRGRVLPVVDLSSRLGRVLEVTDATRILVIEISTGVLGLIVDRVEGVMQIPAHRIEDIPGVVADDALGHQIAAMDDQLIMLIDAERALGGVLPRAPADDRGEASELNRPAPRSPRAPRAPRIPGPAGTPPARRRSAATPQAPRSRRTPRHRSDHGG
ncbi:MAG: chemotaxis protein CheW [Solirubrobacteraceae bacterium]